MLSLIFIPNSKLDQAILPVEPSNLADPYEKKSYELEPELDLEKLGAIRLSMDTDQTNLFDPNENHIADWLEIRLDQAMSNPDVQVKPPRTILTLEKFFHQEVHKNENETKLNLTAIPVIFMGDSPNFIQCAEIFEQYGGTLSHTYQDYLFGFSGMIPYEPLNNFLEFLNTSEIPYFLEEDQQIKSNIYEVSRNMRLRPYIWQDWGFNGDSNSSIAILDSGLDDSHSMMNGYGDANFSAKIVGWYDATSTSYPKPTDDNGHGSHCATIAAGNADPVFDAENRTVATQSWEDDFTGYYFPEEIDVDWTVIQFNITDPGWIKLSCQFEDHTPVDYTLMDVFIVRNGSAIINFTTNETVWMQDLSYNISQEELGQYQFRVCWKMRDSTSDGEVDDMRCSFRASLHWYYNPNPYGEELIWRGIANNTKLVGVKVLESNGLGHISDCLAGIEWAMNNKEKYHITTLSMSFGKPDSRSYNSLVNSAVYKGLVVVVSAGNDGISYYESTPASAENVITVGATNLWDQVTSYSSQGKITTEWIGDKNYLLYGKPDIVAPGGSNDVLSMFAADPNDNDAFGKFNDFVFDDLQGMVGTSMAAPVVAGATSLLIEAMGGYQKWQYSQYQVNLIKSLLLMTATETNLLREDSLETVMNESTGSPTLDRGGQDIHEGFGRINLDMVLEALHYTFKQNETIAANLTSSPINPIGKHGIGRTVQMVENHPYKFNLNASKTLDADIYLYSNNSNSFGAPILLASSISQDLGIIESFQFIAPYTGPYYLVAKAIQGYGSVNITFIHAERELLVDLITPFDPVWYAENQIHAEIYNTGLKLETNLTIKFTINNHTVSSQVISSISPNQSAMVSCSWTPNEIIIYRIECELFFTGEDVSMENNFQTTFIHWDPINRALDNPSLQFSVGLGGKMSIIDEDSFVGSHCMTTGTADHTETYGKISTTLYGPGKLYYSCRTVGDEWLAFDNIIRLRSNNWTTMSYIVGESEVKTVYWELDEGDDSNNRGWVLLDNIQWIGAPPSPVVSGYPIDVNNSVIEWEKSDHYWETLITNYSIYRESAANYYRDALEPYAVVGPRDFSFIDTNVAPGSIWYYFVKPRTEYGEGAFSRVLRLQPGTPSDPTNFTYHNQQEGVFLSWDPPVFEGYTPVENYNVYQVSGELWDDIFDSRQWKRIATLSANETEFLYTGIQDDPYNSFTQYFYVSATNANGTSTQSQILHLYWRNPPPPVYLLRCVSKTPYSIWLSWSSLWNDGGGYTITHYSVYRRENANFSEAMFLADVDFIGWEESHYYTDVNLTPNTTYTYFVTGWNLLGEGSPKILTLTTDAEPDPTTTDTNTTTISTTSTNDSPDTDNRKGIAGWSFILLGIILCVSIWHLIQKTWRRQNG